MPPIQELLEKANDLERRLTDDEVDKLANTLDRRSSHTIYAQGTRVPYRSVDIGLGSSPMATEASTHRRQTTVEQFNLSEQEDAFRFIKSDVRVERRLRFTHAWIKMLGVGRTFYHYQIYGAFWMLKHERGPRRGVIEADLMGLGKTTIALLYVILNFFLVENARHVRRFPGHHLRPSVPGGYQQPQNARCPHRARWPIACRCEEDSVTHQLEVRDGASLVFVPKSLLGNWAAEWRRLQIDPELPIQMYVHHGDFPRESVSLGEWEALRLDVGDAHMAATLRSRKTHHYIVLTTTQSYYARVAEYGGHKMRAWSEDLNARHSKGHLTDGLAWGRVVLDEAHLSVSPDTQTFVILESLSHNGWVPPNFVALTGTPMLRNGVGDMVALVKHINSISPSVHLNQSDASNDGYIKILADRYREHARSFAATTDGCGRRSITLEETSLAKEIGNLQSSYCIRRHSGTVQNGKALAWIPPLKRLDLFCPSPSEARFTVREVEEMLRQDLTLDWIGEVDAGHLSDSGSTLDLSVQPSTLLDNVLIARVMATVPALATYKPRAHLSWKHIASQGWHLNPTGSPFYGSMPTLIASSGKLQMLGEFLARWEDLVTWDHAPEQLVVLSEFALVCHLVHCFCVRKGFECRWIHAQVRTRDRDEIVQTFQASTPQHPQIRILIGSSRIIGQGLTLNRAHRLVLMEPSHHAGVEDQNADRVHRLGSKTDRCWFYRMVNEDSLVEKMLIQHQAGQRRFQDLAEFAGERMIGEVRK